MSIPQLLLRDETGDPPAGWGVQAKRRQIPRNKAYIEVRRSDLPCHINSAVSRSENLTGRRVRVTHPRRTSAADGRFPTASKLYIIIWGLKVNEIDFPFFPFSLQNRRVNVKHYGLHILRIMGF
jgi:hypothetical protein